MIRFAGAILGLLTLAPAQAQGPEPLEIRHIANMGVLVGQGEDKALFDPLGADSYGTYRVADDAERAAIIAGSGAFFGVDLAIFSHRHGDHFDADDALAFLRAGAERRIIAPDETLDLIRNAAAGSGDFLAAPTPLGAGMGCLGAAAPCDAHAQGSIEGAELFHMADVDNIGFLVMIGDYRVLHLGDTQPRVADFSVLDDFEVDVLLYPYWFAEMAEGRAQLEGRFADARQIALHIPERVSHDQARAVFGEGGA